MKRIGHATVAPLIDVNAVYGHGRYPEMIRVCMEDGTVKAYASTDKQPPPRTGKNGWKQYPGDVVGYQMKKRNPTRWLGWVFRKGKVTSTL